MNYSQIIECFGTDYIGVKGVCASENSGSGYWIHELPGFTNDFLNKLANNQTSFDAKAFVAEKSNFAIKEVVNDLFIKLQEYNLFNTSNSLYQTTVGKYTERWQPISLVQRTLKIKIIACSSRFTQVYMPYIDFLFNSTGTFNFRIKEGVYSKEFVVNATAGKIIRVNVDYSAFSFINFSSQKNEIVIELDDPANALACNNSEFECCGQYNSSNDLRLESYSNDVQKSPNSFGMSFAILNRCAYEPFICSINKEMGRAVLYKTGMVILEELLMTNRISGVTLQRREDKEALKIDWEEDYERILLSLSRSLFNTYKTFKHPCVNCQTAAYLPSRS